MSGEQEQIVGRMAEELQALGLRPAGPVLVHTSLSSLGHVSGGPESVVRALLRALGSGGVLLLPALSYRYVHPGQPRFSVRRTPSNVGAIPEHFRQRPGTRRSAHPTHSVCGVGPDVDVFLAAHHHDQTPCGPHSPYRRLRDAGGQILFLGCGLRPNTSMHGVEELVEPPYLFSGTMACQVELEDGRWIEVECRRHGFAGWAQAYDRIAAELGPAQLRCGSVLQATAHLLEARTVWQRGEECLRRDPYHFVEPLTPRCPGT
ncbi:MAG: AAC(3) family N-acetyltransferase [Candidatus Latescibacterota bacterium]